MSSEKYEANGQTHDLDMLIISQYLRVSYPTGSGCREKGAGCKGARWEQCLGSSL